MYQTKTNQPTINTLDCIAPSFYRLHNFVKNETYTDYYCKGGRGSTKSSFPSIEIVLGMLKDPLANAICIMKIGTTVETGVFNQIQWAIDKLGVESYFKANYQKYTFTHLTTGQKIFCKGCDDAGKFKSIKLVKGYFKYQWFEELDSFDGMAEIRKVQQSLTRAGLDAAIRFYSYNPPITVDHWVNRYILQLQKDIADGKVLKTIVHHSTYLTVNPTWLGQQFINDAETLKRTNLRAYEHEYLGDITGTGGQVFANVKSQTITNEDIKTFGMIRRGLDWGFAVDPLSYGAMWFDKNNRRLFIYYEYYKVGASFDEVAAVIRKENEFNQVVRADSAEPRSNNELKKRNINIYPAIKGPGSVDHGIRWLQGLTEIIIDPIRCPNTYREFVGYEYETDRAGNFKSSYPDKNNHSIDMVRYALEQEIGSSNGGKIQVER